MHFEDFSRQVYPFLEMTHFHRTYYRLLRSIFSEGQQSGEFGTAFSVNEMVKTFALWERAVLYDWCLVGGEYPLAEYGRRTMPLFLAGYRSAEGK